MSEASSRAHPSSTRLESTDEPSFVRLEQMVELLLQASLRGRLLPSERRQIQKYLKEKHVVEPRAPIDPGPKCPACCSPLALPNPTRCPHCGVWLLTPADFGSRKRKKPVKP